MRHQLAMLLVRHIPLLSTLEKIPLLLKLSIDPDADQDMHAKENQDVMADAQDLTKSEDDSGHSSEVDETLFLENLEKPATSGELDTIESLKQASEMNS
jgi:hypothetical protein